VQNVGGSLLQIKEDWKARCQLFRKFLRAGAGRLVSGVSGDQPGTGPSIPKTVAVDSNRSSEYFFMIFQLSGCKEKAKELLCWSTW